MSEQDQLVRLETDRALRAAQLITPGAADISIDTVNSVSDGAIELLGVRADFPDGSVAHISRVVIDNFE